MTLLTAGALTDPQLPATASTFARLSSARLLGWRRPGALPPNKNPGYADATTTIHFLKNDNRLLAGKRLSCVSPS